MFGLILTELIKTDGRGGGTGDGDGVGKRSGLGITGRRGTNGTGRSGGGIARVVYEIRGGGGGAG